MTINRALDTHYSAILAILTIALLSTLAIGYSVHTLLYGPEVYIDTGRVGWKGAPEVNGDIVAVVYPHAALKYGRLIAELEDLGVKVVKVEDLNDLTDKAPIRGHTVIVMVSYEDLTPNPRAGVNILTALVDLGSIVVTDDIVYRELASLIAGRPAIKPASLLSLQAGYDVAVKKFQGGYSYVIAPEFNSSSIAPVAAWAILEDPPAGRPPCLEHTASVTLIGGRQPYGLVVFKSVFYKYTCELMPDKDSFYVTVESLLVPGAYLWGGPGREWLTHKLAVEFNLSAGELNLYDASPVMDTDTLEWNGLLGLDLASWTFKASTKHWMATIPASAAPSGFKSSLEFTSTLEDSIQYLKVTASWINLGVHGALEEVHKEKYTLILIVQYSR